jgi:hypothetical protein
VVPAALVAGLGGNLPEGWPQPEPAVPHRKERRGETPLAHVPEGGLEVARAQALEIEPREEALGLEGQIAPARQECRLEWLGSCRQVRHQGWTNHHQPGPDADLAGSAVPVAVAGIGAAGLVAVASEEDVDLDLEGTGAG